MRHIGNLPSAAQARLFKDYLYARGIHNDIEPDADQSWMIWVHAEEQLPAAREALDRFRRDPSAPEFVREAAPAEELRAKEAREDEAFRRRFFTRRQIFPGTITFKAGVLTYALVVLSVTVTLLSNFGKQEDLLRALFISYPEIGVTGFLPEVRAGEAWRLFTPILIHFDGAHLLFNMLWLFQLGSMMESRQGHIHFALLTLVMAAISNVAQYAAHGPGFGGMSGVVYGLFGYIWVRGKFDPGSGLFMDRLNVILMMIWFCACLTGLVGPIANQAHGAGLILGTAYGFLSALVARRR